MHTVLLCVVYVCTDSIIHMHKAPTAALLVQCWTPSQTLNPKPGAEMDREECISASEAATHRLD